MGFLFPMATTRQLGTKAHALCTAEETKGSLLIAEARRVNANETNAIFGQNLSYTLYLISSTVH